MGKLRLKIGAAKFLADLLAPPSSSIWGDGITELGPRQKALVAALRSGAYTQIRGQLFYHWPDGSCSYCVQGVVQKESGEKIEPHRQAVMTQSARLYFRIHVSGSNELLRLNDAPGHLTFPQMADLMEYAPHAFFVGPI